MFNFQDFTLSFVAICGRYFLTCPTSCLHGNWINFISWVKTNIEIIAGEKDLKKSWRKENINTDL